jgi:predicted transcriptional regulator
MIAHQLTIFDRPVETPSFSAQVAAQNAAECPREPQFKPSAKSIRAVFNAMKHGRWMTKAEIAYHSGATEHAVSARLSDLKKQGIRSEKRKANDGSLYEYRLILPKS